MFSRYSGLEFRDTNLEIISIEVVIEVFVLDGNVLEERRNKKRRGFGYKERLCYKS